MWRAAELQTIRVWQQLSQSWSVPIATNSMQNTLSFGEGMAKNDSPEIVVHAHKGMAEMSSELFTEVEPYLRSHRGT
jgi:hypothetical protein